MPRKRIIIITDCNDVAFNEIRAAIIAELRRLNAEDRVEIEPVVNAKEFSVIHGAFLVRLMADVYPPSETVFLVVLNPLSTSRKERARIIGETKKGIKFVGANTGTLTWLIKDFGLREIYESNRKGLHGEDFISFGGKYIHAPIAARVAAGVDLKDSGKPFDRSRLSHLEIKQGTVVHIDNFGVVKIFGKLDKLEEGDKVQVFVNDRRKRVAVFTRSMKSLPDNTWAIYPGSSLNNLPEIAKVRSLSTAEELGAEIGDIIRWVPLRK